MTFNVSSIVRPWSGASYFTPILFISIFKFSSLSLLLLIVLLLLLLFSNGSLSESVLSGLSNSKQNPINWHPKYMAANIRKHFGTLSNKSTWEKYL